MSGPRFHSHALSRRSFLVSIGGFSVGVALFPYAATCSVSAEAADGFLEPNAWITVGPDGLVSVISPASEMGQGVMTTLPLVIADEMDADWEKVRVVQAPSDAETYGNPGFYGIQLTGGSEAVRGYWDTLRLVGAQARKVILASAAAQLGVPATELTTEPGMVLHPRSGRSLDYGRVAAEGELPDPLPQATKADLKPESMRRYIGRRDIGRVDVPSKVRGAATFGIDVQLPGMLFGAVLRSPVPEDQPSVVDDADAKAVKGILKIVLLPYGVGVIGETVEATRRAKDLLVVTWSSNSRVAAYTSAERLQAYAASARDFAEPGLVMSAHGEAAAAIEGAARVIEADYASDLVHHASMEPMNATARIGDGLVDIWAPTQGPTGHQRFAAALTGVDAANVKVHTTLLGGGFGRRAEMDFVEDAVRLASEVRGRPVKVIWSREDDVRHGKYRPLEAQAIRIGLDAGGRIVGWRQRVVADSIFARTLPDIFAAEGGRDDVITEGSDLKYAVPAHMVEYLRQDDGQPVGFWRGVGAGYTKFAVECALDEVAAARGVDPVALRLELLDGEPRARDVVRRAAEMAEWDRPRDGRALGIAYSDTFGSHCAEVAEVSLDRESGDIRVHQVWCAVDPGIAIQPRNIEAQVVGAVIGGISQALYERITVVNGVVQETNFDTYRVLRMSEAPPIHVAVIETPGSRPGGIGEVGLPPVAPAIANAVARLTGGVRLRHLPFLPERVIAALQG